MKTIEYVKRSILFCLCAVLLAGSATGVRAEPENMARVLGNAFADAVERVMPSVVVVRTESTVYHRAQDYFFGNSYGIPERLAGQGSGVIITENGYVLTSLHVVRGADEIEVVLDDGEKYSAKLIGEDMHTDLAVLKIDSDDTFTPIEAGDSEALRVGEFVIAVGSPFSLSSSVSAGIVSQKGRSVGMLPYEDFIQTDASINPGNSGGPLVDAEGRMVGINAMITAPAGSRGSIGIGFATPVNLAMDVAEALMKEGFVKRPWIGVQLSEMPEDLLEQADPSERGVLVANVIINTPAAFGGLKAGDLIIDVDGSTVTSVNEVQKAVLQREVGEYVHLTVLRDGKRLSLELKTDTMPNLSRLRGPR
jgi:serine protease Do